MDLYKFAAQRKLRFPSVRGLLTAEQLFELPLTASSGFDLDSVAKTINAGIKATSEESFVGESLSVEQKELTAALDIVKDVIATRKALMAEAAARTARALERRKLLDAISAKKDQILTASSLEDLEKRLEALDA
jgi:hypothetical protein